MEAVLPPSRMVFLASQSALEVMSVTHWVSQDTNRDFTDVTLVSEDTY